MAREQEEASGLVHVFPRRVTHLLYILAVVTEGRLPVGQQAASSYPFCFLPETPGDSSTLPQIGKRGGGS